jgi:hypothetical protein
MTCWTSTTGQIVLLLLVAVVDLLALSHRPAPGAETHFRCELIETQHEQLWEERHRWARRKASRWTRDLSTRTSIDSYFETPLVPISDAAFLRRLSLTVRGRIPSLEEVRSFLADGQPNKRTRLIDRFLASTQWADGWVGHWQDVLAENPSVVFPTLNNSGAFRQWIYDSFRDNKPFDRFVSELVLLDDAGSGDGPAGFALAAGNDVPMAMRSLVLMNAFAGVDFKCARCHDSPFGELRQSDLFLTAAYLNDGPLEVPATSVAAAGKASSRDLITTSLTAGQIIVPEGLTSLWLDQPEQAASLRPIESGPRGELAALITSPSNRRFSDVFVNRIWKRYFGEDLIDPIDHASSSAAGSRSELLAALSARFVDSGYDIKALARQMLRSDRWQGERKPRARMSAEQLIDSLFVAVGKDFEAETLGVHATDPGAVQLPRPRRAWQFAALPNERDRPSLGMPVNQTIVDTMSTGPFAKVFDLANERDSTRERYGSEFGQRCLLARRLIESGVRFVEVAYDLNFKNGTGWDTHRHGQQNQHLLIEDLDRSLSALVEDLQGRSLLDKTLIVVATEFGRPPDFDGQGGRGHQSEAFSAALFGGGLKTGQVIGTTDELGRKVADHPISVPDFHATILTALGIDPAAELFDDDRPIPITDHGTPIETLFT